MAERNRLQPLNVISFTGGINLRSDAFQLADNEVQLALNVDIDPTSGFQSRRGWSRINNAALAATWNPRALHVQPYAAGERYMVANEGVVLVGDGVTLSTLQVAAVDVACDAHPHLADFVAWLDLTYAAAGNTQQAFKWDGSGDAVLLTKSGPTWQDDYTVGGTGYFPAAEVAATQHGYMFVGNTIEDGTAHPNRVRWSHFNNPEAWAEADYYDVVAGGEHITALVPWSDRLFVFKPSSVHVLDGYNADTWAVTPVTSAVGAIHRQGVAAGEDAVYFLSYPQGIYELSRKGLREISTQLRPALKDGTFNGLAIDNTWLSWVNQKLYVGAPYSRTSLASDAETLLVWDPTLGAVDANAGGAWVAHRGADSSGFGPIVYATVSDRIIGAARATPSLVKLEANTTPVDNLDGTPTAFPMYVTTRWFDAGWPTVKKSWRRPEYVIQQQSAEYYIDFQIHVDYNEGEPRKQFRMAVSADGTAALYDDGTLYDSGAVYASTASGSKIVRGQSYGLARAVRLTLAGQPGKPWGVDAIVLKTLFRRFK